MSHIVPQRETPWPFPIFCDIFCVSISMRMSTLKFHRKSPEWQALQRWDVRKIQLQRNQDLFLLPGDWKFQEKKPTQNLIERFLSFSDTSRILCVGHFHWIFGQWSSLRNMVTLQPDPWKSSAVLCCCAEWLCFPHLHFFEARSKPEKKSTLFFFCGNNSTEACKSFLAIYIYQHLPRGAN